VISRLTATAAALYVSFTAIAAGMNNIRLRRNAAVAATGVVAMLIVMLGSCDRACAASLSASASMSAADSLLNPPISDGKRITVAVALQILNISDIDEVRHRFQMVGYLIAEWKDPRLGFTPQAGWEKFRTYSIGQVWSPHFDFVNAVVPHSAFDTTMRVYPDGTVRYSERSSAELSNTFRLRTFPFDRQTLEILVHPTVAEEGIVEFSRLGGDRSISAEPRVYSSLAQWQVAGLRASVGQIPGIAGESVTEISFTLSIVRRSGFYIWKVFVPLLLMVTLSFTVFWIDSEELNSQVDIAATTILTVIAFAFAIQANLPKVPYLTFIDLFFLVCYLFVFFPAIEITVVHRAMRSGHGEFARRLNRLCRIALPVAFIVVNLLIVARFFG
jgi:hypothetical protein